jgi:hypothetical protein
MYRTSFRPTPHSNFFLAVSNSHPDGKRNEQLHISKFPVILSVSTRRGYRENHHQEIKERLLFLISIEIASQCRLHKRCKMGPIVI